MKTAALRLLIGFIILGLAGGFMAERYNQNSPDCPCCASGRCHDNTKCHNTIKACTCGYFALRVSLPKTNVLPEPGLKGYLTFSQDAGYSYLSAKDIFHPPRNPSFVF